MKGENLSGKIVHKILHEGGCKHKGKKKGYEKEEEYEEEED